MKLQIPLLYPVLMACLMASGVIQAQTPMPQDNWSNYGKKLASPSTTVKKGLTVGSGGIYVGVDSSGRPFGGRADSIQRFSTDGALVGTFSATFTNIMGLDCDSEGNLYVFDPPTVKVFSPTGTLLREWGSAGTGDDEFASDSSPSTMDALAVDENDKVYVCDGPNYRVKVHDKLGIYLSQFGEEGTLPSQFEDKPTAIAVMDSHVFVNAGHSYSVKKFDTQGNYIAPGEGRVEPKTYGSYAVISSSPDKLLLVTSGSSQSLMTPTFEVLQNIVLHPAELGNVFWRQGKGIDFDLHGNIYKSTAYIQSGISGEQIETFYFERRYRTTDNPLSVNSLPQSYVSSVKQRPGTTEIEINYGVKDTNDATVETRLLAFVDGNTNFSNIIPIRTYVGDTTGKLGAGTTTNVDHQLVWNAAADWTADFGQLKVEILAKDTRGLLGMHWITIPANGDDPELVVGKNPVEPDDLTSVCFWLIAGNDPRVILEEGDLKATGGAYTGQVIYSDSTGFSTAGRNFLLRDILGMRPITNEEITRVYSGNFNLKDEMSNYVILLP